MRANFGMRVGLAICIVEELAFVAGNLDEEVGDLLEHGENNIFDAGAALPLVLGSAQTASAKSMFVIIFALFRVP